jgi:hypothetical protein
MENAMVKTMGTARAKVEAARAPFICIVNK